MRIEKVNIPIETSELEGLAPITMEKLGNIVLVAGKNGSGKTRLLNSLKNVFAKIPTYEVQETTRGHILTWKNDVENNEITIRQSGHQINPDWLRSLERTNKDLKVYIANANESLAYIPYLTFDTVKEKAHAIIDFVPKNIGLQDPYNLPRNDIHLYSAYIFSDIGMANTSSGTLPTIQNIQDQWVNTQLPMSELSVGPEEIRTINRNYEKLKEYLKIFLNAELKRDKDGNATLFGKRIGLAQLSDGQKVLLQFCIALYAQETSLDEMIIFMDEPENHLHPAALIEVLDKIIANIPNGQVWIATHSINILAHFDSSNIWYIENGHVSYAGNVPETVLKGLLGTEEEIEKLNSFLSLPAKMASERFAFECLFYPMVAFTGKDDHQTKQIHNIIVERIKAGEKLKLLDFGMGKGRLLASIYENDRLQGINITTWLDYYGFDAFDTYKAECENLLGKIYGENKRYFNSETDALSRLEEGTFDFIIMCNVLHEIEPGQWVPTFTSPNSLTKLLKQDGHLLIVEDQFLAVGEKAHSKGFIVLDNLELKRLFDSKGPIQTFDYRKDGRLKAHLIPAQLLGNISTETKKEALRMLIANAKNCIKNLRQLPPNFKNGKLHSFWAQQLANASLALEEL